MAYTTHGYHIPGSPIAPIEVRPKTLDRCGGVTFCHRCQGEVAGYFHDLNEEQSIAHQIVTDFSINCPACRNDVKVLVVLKSIQTSGLSLKDVDIEGLTEHRCSKE